MPPSSSRRTRTRRAAELQDTSDMEAPDSSPSRPARKRRKVSPQADQQRDLSPQQDGPRNSALSKRGLPDTEMEGNEQEMINAVIASLKQSSQRPQVAYDHSNEIHEHTNRDGVQAYAKVAGRDWTYYVKKLEVNIGRSSEDTAARASVERLKESSPVSHKGGDSLLVDIDLGPSKLVSRLHALIYFDSAGTGKWQIRINGRNSVRVNETIVHRGEKISLGSGDVLDIDGTQMMFVTPENDIRIHPVFLQRAGYSLSGGPGATAQDFPQAQPEPVSEIDRPDGFTRNSTAPTAPPVAEPKRPSTPATSRTIDIEPKSKQSPAYNRGMMLESTERIDYSLDSAKDLKPPYSYATMIGQAILSSEEEKMTLNNIYNWIMDNYAFYRHSQAQWQNSIRHNLSLNKSFQKIPRRTDEPGKGMKWQIVPEHRDEFTKRGPRTSKGGARGSSAPSSPAAKEPSTKLPSVNVRNAGSTGPEDHMEPSNFRQRLQASPKSVTPPLSPYRPTSKGTYTPERSSHLREEENGLPDPVRRGSHAEPRRSINSFALSDQAQDSPPTLSSSAYLDESMPMITPAPRRQMPRLAPPSTAQVPSTYMPTSSPAPFWKYVDFGSTPAKPMAELSPSKSLGLVVPQSSSPPPANDSKDPPSPTKASGVDMPAPEIRTEAQPEVIAPIEPPEETDDSAGFDLARGFQPIGQFHKRMSNGVGGP